MTFAVNQNALFEMVLHTHTYHKITATFILSFRIKIEDTDTFKF